MVWPVWVVQAIWFVATTIISIALAPRPPNRKAAALEDFTIPTAEEGRSIPVIFGTVRITGPNVVWYGDLDKKAIKKKALFSSTTIGYKYYLGMHYVLSFGPIDALLRWEWDDKTAFAGSITTSSTASINLPKLFGGKKGEGGLVGDFDLDMGESAQTPNAYLVAQIGSPLSAYRGVCSVVWKGGYIGNSQYVKPCTFTVQRTAAGWEGGAAWNPADVTIDGGMNPAHLIYEVLTNSTFGYGEPTASIDETSFGAAADQFVAENFGLNLQWVNSEELESFLGEACSHAGMVLTEDPTTGKYVLKLLRDNYVAGDLDVVDESSVIELIRYSRQGWGETVNEVTVLYTDPDSFKTTGITVHDLGNIQAQGRVIAQSIPFPGIRNHEVAAAVASRELAQRSTPLGRGTIRCSRRAWHYQQGDVFRFSWEKEGLSQVVHRVMAIRKGTLEDGSIEIDIAEDIFGIGSATYTTASSVDSVPAQPAEPAEDSSTGGSVLSSTTTAPPGSPADGDAYYVPTGATGVWATHVGEVATWDAEDGDWTYETVGTSAPIVLDEGTGNYVVLDGTGGTTGAPWQEAIQFQDHGVDEGTAGGISTVNFTGTGVTVAESAGVLTVDISGGSGGGSGDSLWAYVEVLLKFTGPDASTTITDETALRAWTAVGNAQLDTAQSKFGGSSLLLDGTGDYISTPNSSDVSVSAGDFTIEAWVRRNSTGTTDTISNKRSASSAQEHSFSIGSTNLLTISLFASGSPVATVTSTTTITNDGLWHHVAATRAGTTVRIFIDGGLEGTTTQSGNPSTNTSSLLLGRDGFDTSRDFDGWIDSYRFTKGVARYTATFSPPTEEFPTGIGGVAEAPVDGFPYSRRNGAWERYGAVPLRADALAAQAEDLVIVSNAVLQDTDLVVALDLGSYAFELFYETDVNATPDMEVRVDFTGTDTEFSMTRIFCRSTTSGLEHYTATPADVQFTVTAVGATYCVGFIEVSAAGDFKVRARQVTSSATSVTFKKNSWLRITDLTDSTPLTIDDEVSADSARAYWKLDEASGNFADSSGGGYTLTITGTPVQGYQFAAADPNFPTRKTAASTNGGQANYAASASALGLTLPITTYTMEAWGRFTGSGILMALGANGETLATNFAGQLLVLTGGILSQFWEYGAGTNAPTISATLGGMLDGKLHHMASVKDAASLTISYYVDGIYVGGGTYTSGQEHTGGTSGVFSIMGTPGDSTAAVDGLYSGAAFYTTALTEARIQAHARALGLFP